LGENPGFYPISSKLRGVENSEILLMVQKSSEKNPPFGCKKTLVNNGISTTNPSTGELFPGFLNHQQCVIRTWNPKQPFINGCFNGMIPNLYIKNGCFTKHPFISGCLGYQEVISFHNTIGTKHCAVRLPSALNEKSGVFPRVDTGLISITPRKMNGWKMKITPLKKEISSSKHSFFGFQPLVFSRV